MIKTITAILLFTLLISKGYGQRNDLEAYVAKGVELHDKGDYKGAIDQYEKALKIDKQSPLANYEISSTYFALNNYKKAIDYSEVVISQNTKFVDQAYIMKGSALDLLGKPKEAVNTYKKGIKDYPQSHLLYYNLALTSYNLKDYKGAEVALQQALTVNPSHASSHLLLGYLMSEQNNRVKSLLALYNFLLLEPQSKRSKPVLELVNGQLSKGVKKENEKSISINLAANKESDEFQAAELMLSLLEASKTVEKKEGKTEQELFTENTNSFFSVLGELKKENKSFWWNYYVDFYYAMKNSNQVETFSYYISQSANEVKVNEWLNTNKEKIDSFSKWYKEYERHK